jgi:predicted nuclease of predicted toxin-antitoxin system
VRFVVDECIGPAVARWLRAHQHDVFSVYDEARGLDDDAVLALAFREDRILITNDTDLGERVFRAGHAHRGVVPMRLSDERAASKIACLRRLLEHHATGLPGAFVVIGESSIRIVRR